MLKGSGSCPPFSLTCCYSSWLFCTEGCDRSSSTLAPEEPVCSGLAFLASLCLAPSFGLRCL